MRIGPRKLGAAGILLLLLVAVTAAYVMGRIDLTSAVLLLGLAVVLVGIAGIEIRLRRVVEQARRETRRALRRDLTKATRKLEQVRGAVRSLAARVDDRAQIEEAERAATRQLLDQQTQLLLARLARIEQATDDTVKRVVEEQRASMGSLAERQRRQARSDLLLVQAAVGLHAALGDYPLPPTGRWASSADLLSYLYRLVSSIEPRLVVECGSGLSSVVIGAALERVRGDGRLVTLDHEQHFADRTRWLLEERSLSARVQVVHAPLEPLEELEGALWYRPSSLTIEDPIDLLVVDGPPGATGPLARLPAVPLLEDRFAPGCVVVLDDTDRKDERAIVERWLELLPGYEAEFLPHEKGTAVLLDPARTPQARWLD